MKDKSKKSTYSTTFGVDPIYLVLNSICVFYFMRIIADVSPVVKPLFSNHDKQRNENNQA